MVEAGPAVPAETELHPCPAPFFLPCQTRRQSYLKVRKAVTDKKCKFFFFFFEEELNT